MSEKRKCVSERTSHPPHPPPPPTVLNKLQIAHPYDTGTFLDLDHTRWNCILHPRFAGWIHRS